MSYTIRTRTSTPGALEPVRVPGHMGARRSSPRHPTRTQAQYGTDLNTGDNYKAPVLSYAENKKTGPVEKLVDDIKNKMMEKQVRCPSEERGLVPCAPDAHKRKGPTAGTPDAQQPACS